MALLHPNYFVVWLDLFRILYTTNLKVSAPILCWHVPLRATLFSKIKQNARMLKPKSNVNMGQKMEVSICPDP